MSIHLLVLLKRLSKPSMKVLEYYEFMHMLLLPLADPMPLQGLHLQVQELQGKHTKC